MNYSELAKKLSKKTADYFAAARLENAVIGLSGGLDSSTTAYLLVQALGEHRVIGVLLPSHASGRLDREHAHVVARSLGIDHYQFDISDLAHSMSVRLHGPGLVPQDDLTNGNITARLRAVVLYNLAARRRALVVGTGDRSELLLGYFTKYGDGACDLLPIGSLYKTEVRELARSLGVPQQVIIKPSSPSLWHGQTAEGELGAGYEKIDEILRLLVDKKMKPALVAKKVRNAQLVARVAEMLGRSEHKRKMPPVLAP
ncbi:putative NH(3)-dependent NAD(+) synthetase [Candidatus Burarchaeum australiense]|nr:putative NH(3)-dependent NAD(+) synthetase [Candidatus Burarchaeum australiense]